MRMALRILSLAGLVAYAGFLLFLLRAGGPDEAKLGPVLFFVGLPFAYLVFCFVTSFRHGPNKALLRSGIIAHIAVLPFIVFTFFVGPLFIVGLVGLGMAVAWFSMYYETQPERKC